MSEWSSGIGQPKANDSQLYICCCLSQGKTGEGREGEGRQFDVKKHSISWTACSGGSETGSGQKCNNWTLVLILFYLSINQTVYLSFNLIFLYVYLFIVEWEEKWEKVRKHYFLSCLFLVCFFKKIYLHFLTLYLFIPNLKLVYLAPWFYNIIVYSCR